MPDLPPRKKRSESFLGVHFDFHAGDDSSEIGQHTTRAMIEEVIRKVQPDFIQCDCKGHRGYSSYPTRVGYPAPGIAADALRVWREVTAEHGVGLYMHYSGVWDTEAIRHHPEWAVTNPDGQRDPNITSTLGAYADRLLIPQLRELAGEYGVDGAWVDGDCWATKPDYSPEAVAAFQKATGIATVPRAAGEPGWEEMRAFFREAFRRYVRHYADALHESHPGFQVASNWAFSSFMPEPVSAEVDFISGDYTLQNSVNSARLEGRCMARQGKPWDLMAWGFSTRLFQANPADDDPAFSTKTALQLKQEAAMVLSLGGGFQAYFTQRRDGAVRLYQMDAMGEVARFCRERQAYCHRAEMVPQVAVLHHGADYYRRNPALFASGNQLGALRGVLQALLENQLAVEVLSDHHLSGRMGEYGLIVLPECETLEPGLQRELLEYARKGGSLLAVGPKTAALFEKELGVEFSGPLQEKADRYLNFEGFLAGLSRADFRPVWLGEEVTEFGRVHVENDTASASDPAGSVAAFGRGKIAALYFDFGERYQRGGTALARSYLGALARELFPCPRVTVSGSRLVDVTLCRKDGHWAVNLVNTGGPHANRDVYTYDEVPPLGPLEVTLRLEEKPRSVLLQPGERAVEWSWAEGLLKVQVPRLELHDIVWID